MLCFSYQPAPFFVLDEVDAALDNTNIGKVCTVFTALKCTEVLNIKQFAIFCSIVWRLYKYLSIDRSIILRVIVCINLPQMNQMQSS